MGGRLEAHSNTSVQLAADTELSVKNGAELLDRLVKDIVSESAASYVSIVQPDQSVIDSDSFREDRLLESATAFSLPQFIPLLQERVFVINPFTRTFLVSWITLLDSIPDLELVVYLPSFLGGLLRFLSDPNQDVHTITKVALDRFLAEIKKIAGIKRGIAESRRSQAESGRKPSMSSTTSGKDDRSDDDASTKSDVEGRPRDSVAKDGEIHVDGASSLSSATTDGGDAEEEYIPGQDVRVNHARILEILVAFLSDSQGECALPVRAG